jgi:CheY-like chemotaxis protein
MGASSPSLLGFDVTIIPLSINRKPSGVRVLIVDDHLGNRMLFESFVEDLGWSSVSVADGLAAVSACDYGEPFDLILMDLIMPGLNGLEATRRIRALGGWAATTPIIGVTADYCASVKAQCLEAGMNECVGKPVNPVLLSRLMQEAVLGDPKDGRMRA